MQHWRDTALVLVGHGSARNPGSRLPTARLAETLRKRDLFGEVLDAYWREPPYLNEALSLLAADTVYVVPNFAGEGYFTREVIPREMGLTGRLTHIGRRRVVYADAVGTHPQVIELVRRRAEGVAAANGLDPAQCCLLLVGHGSSRPDRSGKTTEAVAEALRAMSGFGEVLTAYLEQEPRVADWPDQTAAPFVIAVPLLVAEGLHGSEDLPPLFGLPPKRTGAAEMHGRRVWYCLGVGSEPEIADIVLDLLRRAEAQAETAPG